MDAQSVIWNALRGALYEGFAPDRYASVITALLALRKEKLSQNLDLDKPTIRAISATVTAAFVYFGALIGHSLVSGQTPSGRLCARCSRPAAVSCLRP